MRQSKKPNIFLIEIQNPIKINILKILTNFLKSNHFFLILVHNFKFILFLKSK